ncbi:MAG: GNAT family N-acetyltransferase, partial [Gemmatimonadetes bacterium]|nr:GNAT family N-acetyltransferase [Gemmatimonadota bacterium]
LEPERVVVYEIWVPRPLRRQGVARSVLEQIERLVTDRGYSEVFLRPEPLEPDVDKALLTTFYMRNGYRMIADGVMIKQVAS